MASDHSSLVRLLDTQIGISYASAQCAADVILSAGYRPPAQVIETEEQLTALPLGTVVRWGTAVYQHVSSGWWCSPSSDDASSSEQIIGVAEDFEITVLWSPTEKAGTE